jgi:hypothetical protein
LLEDELYPYEIEAWADQEASPAVCPHFGDNGLKGLTSGCWRHMLTFMKILQTLGRHGGHQEGIFQYRRTPNGLFIDSAVGQAQLAPPTITLTTDEWVAILRAIGGAEQGTFRLTGTPPFATPPNQSLYELLSAAVPAPTGGWQWQDSWKAYVCAILEHEGSIDLYHGLLGQGHSAIVCLARDV